METKIYSSFGIATRASSEQSSCHSKRFRAIFKLYRGLSRERVYRLGNEKLFFFFARKICSKYSRSEEHTSELQSRQYLVCRLLLEKKKKTIIQLSLRSYSSTSTTF